jgi:oligopeptidase A
MSPADSNPLRSPRGLPAFDRITHEHVVPAIEALLDEVRESVEAAARVESPTWQNLVEPMEEALERLGRSWGVVAHLNAVMNSPELREAYNAVLPKVSAFYASLGQDERLHQRYKAMREGPEWTRLTAPRRRILDNELRDFRLGGAELSAEHKLRFAAIQEELASLSARFEENLLDATNDFGWFSEDVSRLAGLPPDVVSAARTAAEQDGKPGYKFTLHAPSYLPVMQYADDRELRAALYRAYATRASEFGKPEWDNTDLIRRIVELRHEEAQLLGFCSYAEVSLEPKMAESPQQVSAFLRDLAARARPYGERDMADLREFAAGHLGIDALEAWDVAYAAEKLRVERYAFSDQEVRQYFPEPKVLKGLFDVIEGLYGLFVLPDETAVWHEDVRFYKLTDRDGTLVGQFYLDLYARQSKRGGAWMDDAISRRRAGPGIQTPVTYLTCNFSGPVDGKPALFTHDEVITLFHEFGHGLHHLLTQIEDLGVSGIHGVEWDAVELPSQFMENFCWEWGVLQGMTAHVDSGEPLPRALYDKMVAARNFQSGMMTLRQIEFSLFDMQLHGGPPGRSAMDILREVRAEVAVVHPPEFNRFPNNFSHIFAGGYAAGYYSYKWAEVLSADAYAAFEEAGGLNAEVGQRFWREILAVGGSRPAIESFKAFRGREPSLEPLLRHNGMTGA